MDTGDTCMARMDRHGGATAQVAGHATMYMVVCACADPICAQRATKQADMMASLREGAGVLSAR